LVRNGASLLALLVLLVLGLVIWRFVSIRRAHRIIGEQHDALARLNADKDTFMRIASHDLKGPLAGIRLQLGLLRQAPGLHLPAAIRPALQEIERTATRSLQIVTDFLDGQVAEAALSRENTRVRPILEAVWTDLAVEARQRQLAWDATVADDVTLPLPAMRLERVLANLLRNAVEHSPRGGTLQVCTSELSELVIRNGAAEPDLARSEREAHADAGYRHHHLGLELARQLVAPAQGTITLRDRTDGQPGTEAVLSFPHPAPVAGNSGGGV
jgi:signal transduction histidine kinase